MMVVVARSGECMLKYMLRIVGSLRSAAATYVFEAQPTATLVTDTLSSHSLYRTENAIRRPRLCCRPNTPTMILSRRKLGILIAVHHNVCEP